MKKNKFTLLVFIFLLTLSSKAQTSGSGDQIMVRTYECLGGPCSSEIVISYGNSKTERIELESLKSKNLEKNTDRINYVIEKIRKSGYKLLTSNAGGDLSLQISTYIFIKE